MVAISLTALLGGALTFVQSLASEGWTRYLVIIFFLGASNIFGEFTGLYVIEGMIETVFSVFNFPVIIPKFAGFSAIFILALFSPLVFYALKYSR